MAIDASASLGNIQRSIKRFFREEIETALSIPVYYDRSLFEPDGEPQKWVYIKFNDSEIKTMSNIGLSVYACTDKDTDFLDCADLRDSIIDVCTDSTDMCGVKRFTLYSISGATWTAYSKILIANRFLDSGVLEGPQGVKFIKIIMMLRTPSKL